MTHQKRKVDYRYKELLFNQGLRVKFTNVHFTTNLFQRIKWT